MQQLELILRQILNPEMLMPYGTVSYDQLMQDWQGLGTAIMVLCALFGLAEGFGGLIIGLVGGAILFAAICLFCAVSWSYVLPFLFNSLGYAAVAAVFIGAGVAVWHYCRAFVWHMDPYANTKGRVPYADKSPKRQEAAARRSYFFGPGLYAVRMTIVKAWTDNVLLIKRTFLWIRSKLSSVNVVMRMPLWMLGGVYLAFLSLSIAIVGSLVTALCTIVHVSLMSLMTAVIYVLFSILWAIDRAYLELRSIHTSCPVCQHRHTVPHFVCPECGRVHTRLVPGSYGILARRCKCGRSLPTTFMLGRSGLAARCPDCNTPLYSSDARQVALSMVGGTSSGKTVLLSSLMHTLQDMVRTSPDITLEIPSASAAMFRDLDTIYNGAGSVNTPLSDTATMYSVMLEGGAIKPRHQFSVYDIAGEVFSSDALKRMLPQKQMLFSDGLLLVVDPLSTESVLNGAIQAGNNVANHSMMSTADVVNGYVDYIRSLTTASVNARSSKPVAVIIAKSDLSYVNRRLSYLHIRSVMSRTPGIFTSFADARSQMCRDFLVTHGMESAVNAIEAFSSNVQYFPVSAMGHPEDGTPFSPIRIMEPVAWLLNQSHPDLVRALGMEKYL